MSSRRAGLPNRPSMRHDAHYVDVLASRHDEPVGAKLPIELLEPNPLQPRTQMGELNELIEKHCGGENCLIDQIVPNSDRRPLHDAEDQAFDYVHSEIQAHKTL